MIHEHFCCNRRSAATTSLRPVGSPLGPSTYCTSTHRILTAPRTGLATRLSAFATNRHESCGLVSQGLKLCKLCDVEMGIKTIMPTRVCLTGESPSSRYRANFRLNEWPTKVERDTLPLDLVRARSLPDIAFVTRRRRCGQMRGRWPRKTGLDRLLTAISWGMISTFPRLLARSMSGLSGSSGLFRLSRWSSSTT